MPPSIQDIGQNKQALSRQSRPREQPQAAASLAEAAPPVEGPGATRGQNERRGREGADEQSVDASSSGSAEEAARGDQSKDGKSS